MSSPIGLDIMETRAVPFTYSRDGRVLICTLCPGAVVWDPVKIRLHLYTQHGLPKVEREALLRDFMSPDRCARTEEELHPLLDGSLIELALPVIRGFQCTRCTFYTASKKEAGKHQATHSLVPRKPGRPSHASSPPTRYVPALLQCWRPMFTATYLRRYWTVAPITSHHPDEISQIREAYPPSRGGGKWQIVGLDRRPDSLRHNPWENEIIDQAVVPESYTVLSPLVAPQEPVEDRIYRRPTTLAESGIWLSRTRWPIYFHGRCLAAFSWASAYSSYQYAADYTYPSTRFVLESSMGDESHIAVICTAVNVVMSRCIRTLEDSSHEFLCWVNTSQMNGRFWDRPVKPHHRPATRQRYIRCLKRLLCYLFRTWRVPLEQRKRIFGIRISSRQQAIMRKIWAHLDRQAARQRRQEQIGFDDTFGWYPGIGATPKTIKPFHIDDSQDEDLETDNDEISVNH